MKEFKPIPGSAAASSSVGHDQTHFAGTWPDLETLVFPRDPQGRDPDPVLDALAELAAPWNLVNMAYALREYGAPIPKKAEAEYAAAAHWLIGHAIRAGSMWRAAASEDLKRRREAAHSGAPHSADDASGGDQ